MTALFPAILLCDGPCRGWWRGLARRPRGHMAYGADRMGCRWGWEVGIGLVLAACSVGAAEAA